MNASTVPTFAEFAALLTSEQQRILDAMDSAIASNDRAQYAAQHALFIELGAAFDALWKHKEATRKAQQPAGTTGGAIRKTVPNHDFFELARHSHGVLFDETAVARLGAAAQGLQTILAMLQQRELDSETLASDVLSFGPCVAQGLLAAAAVCAEALQTAVEGQGAGVAQALCSTPGYAVLEAAHRQIRDPKQGL